MEQDQESQLVVLRRGREAIVANIRQIEDQLDTMLSGLREKLRVYDKQIKELEDPDC